MACIDWGLIGEGDLRTMLFVVMFLRFMLFMLAFWMMVEIILDLNIFEAELKMLSIAVGAIFENSYS